MNDRQQISGEQAGLSNRELTPQERRMTGSSELHTEHFYKPTFVVHFPESVGVVNGRRQEIRYIDASLLVNGSGGNPTETYYIDLPPLDPTTGETRYDPSIWQVGIRPDTGEKRICLDKELTLKVYSVQKNTADYDLHHREGKWKWEVEARDIEGNQGYSPEGMQRRK